MSILDDEIMQDAADDARTIAYIQSKLPEALAAKYTAEALQPILDAIVEAVANSSALDAEADSEGFVDLDMEDLVTGTGNNLRDYGEDVPPAEELERIVDLWFDAEEQYSE